MFDVMEASSPNGAEDEPDIGRNIVLARGTESAGHFARRLGVSRPQLSSWENGHFRPSLLSLKKIALLTGRTVDWFLEDHQDRGGGGA